MVLNKKIRWLLLLIGFTSFTAAFAQQGSSRGSGGGTIISGKAGVSFLETEVFRDYSDIVQFNNRAGSYAGLEISRFFIPFLETGAGFSWSALKGHAETSDLSVLGIFFNPEDPLSAAADYNIRLYGPEVFARFHIGRNLHSQGSINFFIKAGAGIQFYEMELLFSDPDINALIFGNNYEPEWNSDMVYSFGGGLSYGISEIVRLKLEVNLNRMEFDLPDILEHFNPGETRQSIPGVFTNYSAGIAIKLNQQQRSNKHPNFPFSP